MPAARYTESQPVHRSRYCAENNGPGSGLDGRSRQIDVGGPRSAHRRVADARMATMVPWQPHGEQLQRGSVGQRPRHTPHLHQRRLRVRAADQYPLPARHHLHVRVRPSLRTGGHVRLTRGTTHLDRLRGRRPTNPPTRSICRSVRRAQDPAWTFGSPIRSDRSEVVLSTCRLRVIVGCQLIEQARAR